MKLPFKKLEGLGNCYIFVEARNVRNQSLTKLALNISNVTTGIGSDGLIVIDSRKEPFGMRIFNRDGSEAELCGNGLRQAALFIKSTNYPRGHKFIFRTIAGDFQTEVLWALSNRANIKTFLGKPDFRAEAVGLKQKYKLAFNIKLKDIIPRNMSLDCISLGNPHAVIWVNNFDFDWQKLGRTISPAPIFPKGINVHFCRVVNPRKFQMKIYERGSGPTQACGSGAAACLAVGVMRNYLNNKASAEMPGGTLKLHWDFKNDFISQEGPASIVCSGEYFH